MSSGPLAGITVVTLEQAVSAVLEVPAALGGAAGIAPAVAELYRSLIDHIDEEWRGRLR